MPGILPVDANRVVTLKEAGKNTDPVNDCVHHSGLQLAGLFLWRTGLLLAGGTALYNVVEKLLQFIDLPRQLEIGVGFLVAGAIVVMISFIMERIVDMRAEGDLRQP